MLDIKSFDLGGVILELKLGPHEIVKVETALDESIMTLFVKGRGDIKMPPINKVLKFLHRANVKSGITEKAVFDGYIKFIEQGNTTNDLIEVINELIDSAGFYGKKEEKVETETFTLDSLEETSEEVL